MEMITTKSGGFYFITTYYYWDSNGLMGTADGSEWGICSRCQLTKRDSYDYDGIGFCQCEDILPKIKILQPEDIKELCELFYYPYYGVINYYRSTHVDRLKKHLGEKISLIEYLAKYQRQEPNESMKKLIPHLLSGAYKLAVGFSEIMILYVGTDLTPIIEPQIEQILGERKCTYSVTGDVHFYQKGFQCGTCFPNDSTMIICESCADLCHRNHNVSIKYFLNTKGEPKVSKSMMFCDCHLIDCKC